MDYILKISGDFKKGECEKCPLADGYSYPIDPCELGYNSESCPLEEVKQGEWIDNIVERLEAATDSVYNEMKGDYFDYIKTADAIEIVKGSKDEGILI